MATGELSLPPYPGHRATPRGRFVLDNAPGWGEVVSGVVVGRHDEGIDVRLDDEVWQGMALIRPLSVCDEMGSEGDWPAAGSLVRCVVVDHRPLSGLHLSLRVSDFEKYGAD